MFFFVVMQRPPRSSLTYTLFPYTTLFRSLDPRRRQVDRRPFRGRGFGPIALHPLARVILRHEIEIERLARLILPKHADLFSVQPHRHARLRAAAHIACCDPVERLRRQGAPPGRPEERRVGNECVSPFRSRRPPFHSKKKYKKTI